MDEEKERYLRAVAAMADAVKRAHQELQRNVAKGTAHSVASAGGKLTLAVELLLGTVGRTPNA